MFLNGITESINLILIYIKHIHYGCIQCSHNSRILALQYYCWSHHDSAAASASTLHHRGSNSLNPPIKLQIEGRPWLESVGGVEVSEATLGVCWVLELIVARQWQQQAVKLPTSSQQPAAAPSRAAIQVAWQVAAENTPTHPARGISSYSETLKTVMLHLTLI